MRTRNNLKKLISYKEFIKLLEPKGIVARLYAFIWYNTRF